MKKNYSSPHLWQGYKKLLLIMKLSIAMNFLLAFVAVANTTYSQNSSFTMTMKDVTVKDVIKTIEANSDYRFFYNDELSDISRKVDVDFQEIMIDELLTELFTNTEISYKVFENNLIVIAPESSIQQKLVTGRVTDASTGETLPGVNIRLDGTTTGVVTDHAGKYSIQVSSDDAILLFSYIGYNTESIAVGGGSVIDVALIPNIQSLEEVVVIGYGTARKADITGASSAITVKDFKNQDVTRIDQVLQGRAAGVQVENVGGAPGSPVKIRIRGANSVLGNNNPLYVVDGFVGADFNSVNPQDIEDIQVLKDASATAIYGSRGANGVVLITTKKGKKGVMSFELISKFSSSDLPKKLDVLSPVEFAEVVNERNVALGFPAHFSQSEIEGFRSGEHGTDWQDAIFRNGLGQEYQLSVSGGNESTTYYISGNYLNQDGIVQNTNYTKYTLRSNVTSDISDKLKVRLNITAAKRIRTNVGIGSGAAVSAVSQALAWSPTVDMIDPETGTFTKNDGLTSIDSNPMALLYNSKNIVNNSSINAIGGLSYEFIPGLTLDISGAVDYNEDVYSNFIGGLVRDNGQASARRQLIDYTTLMNTNMLTYEKKFGLHGINVVAVYEQSKYTDQGFNAEANDLSTEAYEDFALNLGTATINSIYHNSALQSLLGRAMYSYNDRYSITLSVRRDGSSKFQKNNRWSTFPSVGLAWRASEETFIKNLDIFDNLKLRASWGKTGSQAIGAYATLPTFSSDRFTFDRGDSYPILRYNQTANPDLKWETTTQTNMGIDMGFLKNRVSIEFDYFDKKTTDLLVAVPLPMYNGGGTINKNVGEVSNKGIEFSINAVPIETGDFNWRSTLNYSYVKNKVVALAEADSLWFSNNLTGAFSQSEMALIVGQPMGSYWGVEYLGTWKPSEADEAATYGKAPGDSKYLDENGDGEADYRVIGNGMPKYSLGWNNTFSYKNLTLNIFLQGVFGYEKWNITYAQGMTYDRVVKEAIFSDIHDRYIPGVNETSDIPAFSPTNQNIVQSSRFLEKGDFLRIKNVSLSYNLPKSLLKFVSASVFVNATNLMTFTKYKGYDPEATSYGPDNDRFTGIDYGGYPNARTITGGLTLTF